MRRRERRGAGGVLERRREVEPAEPAERAGEGDHRRRRDALRGLGRDDAGALQRLQQGAGDRDRIGSKCATMRAISVARSSAGAGTDSSSSASSAAAPRAAARAAWSLSKVVVSTVETPVANVSRGVYPGIIRVP